MTDLVGYGCVCVCVWGGTFRFVETPYETSRALSHFSYENNNPNSWFSPFPLRALPSRNMLFSTPETSNTLTRPLNITKRMLDGRRTLLANDIIMFSHFSIDNLASSPIESERTTVVECHWDDIIPTDEMEPNCGRVSSGDERLVTCTLPVEIRIPVLPYFSVNRLLFLRWSCVSTFVSCAATVHFITFFSSNVEKTSTNNDGSGEKKRMKSNPDIRNTKTTNST